MVICIFFGLSIVHLLHLLRLFGQDCPFVISFICFVRLDKFVHFVHLSFALFVWLFGQVCPFCPFFICFVRLDNFVHFVHLSLALFVWLFVKVCPFCPFFIRPDFFLIFFFF